MKNGNLRRRLRLETLENRVTMDAAALLSLPDAPEPVAGHEVGHLVGLRHDHDTSAALPGVHKVADVTLKRGVMG